MSDSETPSMTPDEARRRQIVRFALIAGGLIALLVAIYWFFLRTAFEPLLTGVAQADAVDIVKVLEDRKIAYRLEDGGRTILVQAGQADQARLELAGSELPMRGQVEFELFNQSDMGLTEFAQKINYQRALQGELARTLLLLEGIESVRVHLGLPERTLFRDEQDRPKASVALILKPGTALTEARVAGIQRMVAGAVPALTPDAVAVLDATGRLVSRDAPPPAAMADSDAIIAGYRGRIEADVAALYPDLRFSVLVSLRQTVPVSVASPAASPATLSPASPAASAAPPPSASAASGQSAVNVRITTAEPLDETTRREIERVAGRAIAFNPARGDAIVFLIGDPALTPQPLSQAAGFPQSAVGERIVARSAAPPPAREPGFVERNWWWLAPLAALLIGLPIWLAARRGSRMGDTGLEDFAESLRRRLAEEPAPGSAVS